MTLEWLEVTTMEKTEVTQRVPRKLRGTMTIKADDDMEFRADRVTGLSSQEEIAKTANAKLYRTVGQKKRSTVAHITIPEEVVDIQAFLMDEVERLTKGYDTKAPKRIRGTRLLLSDDLNITFNKSQRVIEATFTIDLEKTPAYNNRLITLMQRISQCFASNQTTLASVRK